MLHVSKISAATTSIITSHQTQPKTQDTSNAAVHAHSLGHFTHLTSSIVIPLLHSKLSIPWAEGGGDLP